MNTKAIGAMACLAMAWTLSTALAASPERQTETRNVDEFGAVGDGVTDDSLALVKAVHSFGAGGGILRLSCGKSYFIGRSIMLAAPGVTLRGCWTHPTLFSNSVGFPDRRFVGSVDTVGKIVRAPSATISIGGSGGLAELAIVQEGVTVPMPDTSTYAGTAVALAPGGKGMAAHLDDVMIIGGALCVDGGSGGAFVEFHHVDEDCLNGNRIGESAGGSVYDDVDMSVFGTQDFAGYPIRELVGDGTTTTVTFAYPATVTAPAAFPVGDIVTLPGVTSAQGQLYPSVYGYVITASARTGRIGRVTFASTADTARTPVTARGNLTEYTRQFLRPGTAMAWTDGCDDTHIGRSAEFGYAIGFDVQCHGILNVDHMWADNSRVGLRIGSRRARVADVTINSYQFAGTGGVGLGIESPASAPQTNVMIGTFVTSGIAGDCAQVDGILQFGSAWIEGCARFGFDVAAGSRLYGDSLYGKLSTIGQQLLVPGRPAENVQVAHIATDGRPGASLYGGARRLPSVLASAAVLNLPVSSVTGGTETYAVSGAAEISTIAACWGDRTIRLIFTGTARLATGGNIAAAAGGAPGKIVTLVCDGSATPGTFVWRQPR